MFPFFYLSSIPPFLLSVSCQCGPHSWFGLESLCHRERQRREGYTHSATLPSYEPFCLAVLPTRVSSSMTLFHWKHTKHLNSRLQPQNGFIRPPHAFILKSANQSSSAFNIILFFFFTCCTTTPHLTEIKLFTNFRLYFLPFIMNGQFKKRWR